MRRRRYASLFATIFLVAIATTAYAAIPSFRGYTGLMAIPTADALGRGDWDAGVFFESVADGTINDYVANYGIGDRFEVGFDRYRFNDTDRSDAKTLLNAKYEFFRETVERPAVAAGVIDLTNDLNTTVYIVASKSIFQRMGTYEGEVITPRVHVGFGAGEFKSLFAGVSAYLGRRIQLMFEWDSVSLNAGARFRVTRDFTVHAGFFNIADNDSEDSKFLRSSGSFGVGVSYSSSY